jgi:hypothetical protein
VRVVQCEAVGPGGDVAAELAAEGRDMHVVGGLAPLEGGSGEQPGRARGRGGGGDREVVSSWRRTCTGPMSRKAGARWRRVRAPARDAVDARVRRGPREKAGGGIGSGIADAGQG